MEHYSIITLPLELIILILRYMTKTCIFNLYMTSNEYSWLLNDELWYSIVCQSIQKPLIYIYNGIKHYNDINHTKYNNWVQLYFDLITRTQSINKYSLVHAVNEGHLELVRLLLSNPNINVDIPYSELSKYIPIELLKGKSSSCLLILSSAKGYVDILRVLLNDRRFNPSEPNNMAIRTACEHGHVKCVEILLNDMRVDPTDCSNDALISACETGQYEVVSVLLKDKRINPSDLENAAIGTCILRNDINIARLLLEDGRVNPKDRDNMFILHAMKCRYFDMLELLMN